jgi:hypothetical protein
MAFLAICLRFATVRHQALDSLSNNAYSMYLNHYVFIVWLQFAVLGLEVPALVKAAAVFASAMALSWGAAVAFGHIPSAIAAHWISGRPARATLGISRRANWPTEKK